MKSSRLDYLYFAAGLLLLWQLAYWAAGAEVLSSPAETIARAIELVRSSEFWVHARATTSAFAVASIISIAGGIVLGLWLGLRRFAGDVASPILGSLYSIPKITLYPLILLAFGLGASAKIAFGVIHGIFPVVIFTMNAVRNVAPVYHRTAHIMRLSPLATVTTIMAPAALPEILAGIRAGIALTLLGTLIGELFASSSGIGFALVRAMGIHNVTDILALTLLIFVFAGSLNASLHIIERWMRHGG